MQDSDTQVPDWLTIKEFTISGTPPEQLTGRKIDLVFVVKNEYQTTQLAFTLNIEISLAYALKLIFSYVGGLLTVFGLVFYFPKIYNILFKIAYRYPRDFTLVIGETITEQMIYPIPFIADAFTESRLILEYLSKKILREIKSKKKEEIVTYFTDPITHQLDHQKLTQTIQEVAVEIRNKNPSKLELYTSGVDSRKVLIRRLVANDITIKLLDTSREKETKKAFDNIKRNLFDYIVFSGCSDDGICEFSVNKEKLEILSDIEEKSVIISSVVKEHGIMPHKSKQVNDLNSSKFEVQMMSSDTFFESNTIIKELTVKEELPVRTQNININLLADVIEAYAFNMHNLDVEAVDVEIEVREQRPISGFKRIRQFLKWDLQLIGFYKKGQHVIYGLSYEVRRGCLVFQGVPDWDMKNKKIVIQIMSKRGRILRELWLFGMESDSTRECLINQENL